MNELQIIYLMIGLGIASAGYRKNADNYPWHTNLVTFTVFFTCWPMMMAHVLAMEYFD